MKNGIINIKAIKNLYTTNKNKFDFIYYYNKKINKYKDLKKLSYVSRNKKYATTRVIYLKNGYVIGQEILNTKLLKKVKYNKYDDSLLDMFDENEINYDKLALQVKYRFYYLGADEFYILTNIPNKKLGLREKTIFKKIVININKTVFDLKGYVVMNNNSYMYFGVENENIVEYENEPIYKYMKTGLEKKIKYNPDLNFRVTEKIDLLRLMISISKNNNYSCLILLDNNKQIKLLQDINNTLIKQDIEQIRQYIDNLKESYEGESVILVTRDNSTFIKSKILVSENIIQISLSTMLIDERVVMCNSVVYKDKENV